MTRFRSPDHEWGMDRSTKNFLLLRWRLKLGCHFLIVQIIFNVFSHKLLDLHCLTTSKVWISWPKISSHSKGNQNQVTIFYQLNLVPIFFHSFCFLLHTSDWVLVAKLQVGCGQVNWKILVIKMVTEIWLPIFKGSKF